jgi:hypothetical protein
MENKKYDDIELGLTNIKDLQSIYTNKIKSIKLTQISMKKLCWKMLSNNMSWIFILHILINILLSSMLIPTLFKISNDTFVIKTKITQGIYFVVFAIGCEIISIIHKNQVIEPNRRIFIARMHCNLEDEINHNIAKINWNKLRDLNKNELDRKKAMAKWYILGFINNIISTFISLFSFFGYTFWIGMISPMSLIIYIGILGILIYFYPHAEKVDIEQKHNIWDKYYNLQTGLYTDIIHHNGKKTLDNMKNCMEQVELVRDEEKKNDSMFTDSISIIFNIGFIINCLILAGSFSPSDIIIYIQYSCLMRNSVTMCIGMYINFKDSKREYEKLENLINTLDERIEIEQKVNYNKITITQISTTFLSRISSNF